MCRSLRLEKFNVRLGVVWTRTFDPLIKSPGETQQNQCCFPQFMPRSTHCKVLKLLGHPGPAGNRPGHSHGPGGSGKSGGSVASARERRQLIDVFEDERGRLTAISAAKAGHGGHRVRPRGVRECRVAKYTLFAGKGLSSSSHHQFRRPSRTCRWPEATRPPSLRDARGTRERHRSEVG